MRRGDVTVFAVTAVSTVVTVAAVAYSLLGLDKESSAVVSQNSRSSWLVVTWAPGFCAAEPAMAACASGEVDATGQTFLLHGLWPQPPDTRYCGLTRLQQERGNKAGEGFAPVELSEDVDAAVRSVTVDTANLVSHEWYTHGTCSAVSADAYFGDAVALTEEVRDVLDPAFRSAAGGRLTLSAIRSRFEERFGAGAGERVALGCRNVTGVGAVVADVRLSLPPVATLRAVDDSLSLGPLLAQAPPIATGCRQGRVL